MGTRFKICIHNSHANKTQVCWYISENWRAQSSEDPDENWHIYRFGLNLGYIWRRVKS